jgi:cytochrome c biogenesis protein CcmG/thiol:disulfide interchange protein DsbE
MRLRLFLLLVSMAVAAGCAASSADPDSVPELPVVTADDVTARLADSARPVVLNVWASWCLPCRSEAPLLERAASEYAGTVDFIGLDVRDDQDGARGFVAEFFPGAAIIQLHDPGGDIPVALGGSRGVPLTFFYAAGGELVSLHSGVLDERTLALEIDEIVRREGT